MQERIPGKEGTNVVLLLMMRMKRKGKAKIILLNY